MYQHVLAIDSWYQSTANHNGHVRTSPLGITPGMPWNRAPLSPSLFPTSLQQVATFQLI